MKRITKEPEERRSELIACAQQLFYTQGYENTSVSDIVSTVGVAKGTFYYYFGSKLAILEAAVAELAADSAAHLQRIVQDETLTATRKWVRAIEAINNWKTDHKTELMAILQALRRQENALLKFKIQERSTQMLVPELARIIAQGVAEGVFDVAHVEDAAEITFAMMSAMSNTFVDLLLYPERYDDPAALAWRKVTAVQAATERVLGAPAGSLPLVDSHTFFAWFGAPRELAHE